VNLGGAIGKGGELVRGRVQNMKEGNEVIETEVLGDMEGGYRGKNSGTVERKCRKVETERRKKQLGMVDWQLFGLLKRGGMVGPGGAKEKKCQRKGRKGGEAAEPLAEGTNPQRHGIRLGESPGLR